MRQTILLGLLLITAPGLARADLAERIRAAVDGEIRMEFEAREGVYGTSSGGIILTDSRHESWDTNRNDCLDGPVAVVFEVSQGRVRSLDSGISGWIGGRRDRSDVTHPGVTQAGDSHTGVTDLGKVPAAEASAWLLDLARHARPSVAEDAVTAAALCRATRSVPDLERLAADDDVDPGVRGQALFLMSTYHDPATLDAIVRVMDGTRDVEVRKQGVFALSQCDELEAVEELKDIALTERNREVRNQAVFWLGQSEHDEAFDFLEELITR